jgi:HD superfamily phosphohydrolase
MLVFARYVMFSEVYWHHTVRAATAMIQRAYVLLEGRLSIAELSRATDHEWISAMRNIGKGTPASELLEGLFGPTRRIYKRLAQFNYLEERELYEKMTRRPYSWLQQVSANFARLASEKLGQNVAPDEILFDAPPMEREIQFDLDVYHTKEGCYRRLGDVSPVVRTLAREQFDDYVKRVRIYVHPRWRDELRVLNDLNELVKRAID